MRNTSERSTHERGAMRYLGAIILQVVLGQHRGCESEYQLEKIDPGYLNIEKSVLRNVKELLAE